MQAMGLAPADYEEVLQATLGYTGPGEYYQRITRWNEPFLASLGVSAVLEHVRAEIDLAMAQAGCAHLADITRELVLPRRT